jgi:hypothetical protein
MLRKVREPLKNGHRPGHLARASRPHRDYFFNVPVTVSTGNFL